MIRSDWSLIEIDFLVENYASMTIKELKNGLKELSGADRSDDSINAKIKRLKSSGRIEGQKDAEAVHRSLTQRRKTI